MGTKFRDVLDKMPPERREKIEAEGKRLIAEQMTLQNLRKAHDLTQVELAKKLGVKQASIAKLEQRSDLLISTLRNAVEAMGGKLNLSVEFPGSSPVFLTGLGEVENTQDTP